MDEEREALMNCCNRGTCLIRFCETLEDRTSYEDLEWFCETLEDRPSYEDLEWACRKGRCKLHIARVLVCLSKPSDVLKNPTTNRKREAEDLEKLEEQSLALHHQGLL